MFKDVGTFECGHAEGSATALETKAGFGRCSKGDCPCQAFEGGMSANNCTNCGHAYGDHW